MRWKGHPDWYPYKGGYIAAMGQYWRARKELRQEFVELLAARAHQLAKQDSPDKTAYSKSSAFHCTKL
jgi:hypothetical protein